MMQNEPAVTAAAADGAADGAAAADGAFGAELYRVLASDATDTVFSPLSVASALTLAWFGARGQTAAELGDVLHLTDPRQAAAALRAAAELAAPDQAAGPVTFRAPNTVWLQAGLPISAEFTARLRDAAAELVAADFAGAPDAARKQVNRVIAEQTAGKITDLLAPGSIGSLTRLVLASAVYLKARWAEPFAESATRDAPFYPDGPDRPAATVRMMRGTASRAYLRGDGYQAVVLPYRGTSLAMAVVLPDGPLSGLRAAIAGGGGPGGPGGPGRLLAGASRARVALSLPRFRLTAGFELIPALQRLGIRQAFGDQADFSGMTGDQRVPISAVAHKAYVHVDENGTEAAAATAIVAQAMAAFRSPPVTMTVDRPFLFTIYDAQTGRPLFVGQVSHPEAGV